MSDIYIYHIPGKKIGVTRNLEKRVTQQQGYKQGEYEVLCVSSDIEWISKEEKRLQRLYGYNVDFNSYANMAKQNKDKGKMKINVTDQTTTFPVATTKLEAYLKENKGFKFMVDNVEVRINDKMIAWLKTNARVSHFRKTRSYVYNQSMKSFVQELALESKFKKEPKATPFYAPNEANVYDLIRGWAQERGIYANGDSKTQYVKLMEESGELAQALLKEDEAEITDAIGDMVVVLTNLAKLEGLDIEDCVTSAYDVIKTREGKMVNGTFVKNTL
jgi:NTP pyrophosphatase (non-canonical NTP hydrolase)